MLSGLKLIDTPFDPSQNEKVVLVRQPKGQNPLYQVWLYLEGSDLAYVDSVTYHLHPTFPQPMQRVIRSVTNPLCSLSIWTWGIFTVRAVVADKRGGSFEIEHYLSYNKKLNEPDVRFRRM